MEKTLGPKLLSSRKFDVNYTKIDENTWRAESELLDDLHHIKTTLEISTVTKRVLQAKIEFLKSPLENCPIVQAKAQQIIGTRTKDLGFRLFRTFLGKNGCSQVYLLFGLAGPGFENIYDLNEISEGRLTQEAYNAKMKSDCLAHRVGYQNQE